MPPDIDLTLRRSPQSVTVLPSAPPAAPPRDVVIDLRDTGLRDTGLRDTGLRDTGLKQIDLTVVPERADRVPTTVVDTEQGRIRRVVSAGDQLRHLLPIRVVALVPAHNEEAQIAATIESLLGQRRQPDEIVVVADNCTDATVEIARRYPVRVIETVGNQHKKAGALNQALEQVLPALADSDAILVMDADSVLDRAFLRHAESRLGRGGIRAVGGTFYGQDGGGFVGMCQRNEYARYARDVARRKGKVLVLTGTATVFEVSVLREVQQARATGVLPGGEARVYDVRVLTEDNELTLALLHLGHRIVSPLGCRLTTEVMPTWRLLARQRLRWKRGAIENLVDYGWSRVTAQYWLRQVLSLMGVLVTFTYLLTLLLSVAITRNVAVRPLWLAVTAVFALERIVTVRRRGFVQMAVSGVLVVEMFYDVFLQAVQARAFLDAALRRERRW